MTVEPSVSIPGELVRQLTPSSLACRVGCGEKCKHEQRNFSKNLFTSISDFISANWVHQGEVIAMSRPAEEFLPTLLPDLISLGVKTILNVQELDEHPHCGELLSSGFTYLPETVMKAGLTYYNFPAPDFGVWDPSMIYQIVSVVEFGVTEGAVAIHCHAGLGRTGVVCAAYLVYNKGLTGNEANRIVRQNRPGSIQTRQQLQSVLDFENFLKKHRKWPNSLTVMDTFKLQAEVGPKQSKIRKKYNIRVPHFLDFCYAIIINEEFNQQDDFNLEHWLLLDRIKGGLWPSLRLLNPGQIAQTIIDWLFALDSPIIEGAGRTEYLEELTSLSALVSARIAIDMLRFVSIEQDQILKAITHSTTYDPEIVTYIYQNDPTLGCE